MLNIDHNERKKFVGETEIQINRKRMPYCQSLAAERKKKQTNREVWGKRNESKACSQSQGQQPFLKPGPLFLTFLGFTLLRDLEISCFEDFQKLNGRYSSNNLGT